MKKELQDEFGELFDNDKMDKKLIAQVALQAMQDVGDKLTEVIRRFEFNISLIDDKEKVLKEKISTLELDVEIYKKHIVDKDLFIAELQKLIQTLQDRDK